MAIRQFQIPGKLINTPTDAVFRGNTGQYGWSYSASPNLGIWQRADAYTGENHSLLGAFSVWFFIESAVQNDTNILLDENNTVGTFPISNIGFSSAAPTLTLRGHNATPVVIQATGTTSASLGTWHHLLLSWDLTSGNTFANDFHMYLDDVDIKPGSGTFVDGTELEWMLDVNTGRIEFGNTTALSPNWALSTVWFTHSQYIDFSVQANRRKFIDSSGDPVALGLTGELPTGTQPEIYLDDPVATILTQRGSAGDFLYDFLGSGVLIDVAGPNP